MRTWHKTSLWIMNYVAGCWQYFRAIPAFFMRRIRDLRCTKWNVYVSGAVWYMKYTPFRDFSVLCLEVLKASDGAFYLLPFSASHNNFLVDFIKTECCENIIKVLELCNCASERGIFVSGGLKFLCKNITNGLCF